MHDPRVGRFFAVDPLFRKYPYNSVYAFSENRVIHMVELEGLESYIPAPICHQAIFSILREQDFVFDATATFSRENYKLSGTVGYSRVFNVRPDGEKGRNFTHYGVSYPLYSGGSEKIMYNLKTQFSIGIVNGIEKNYSEYSGFFIGLSGEIDGIGIAHSGFFTSNINNPNKESQYVGATSVTLDPIKLAAVILSEQHAGSVSINVDFFVDEDSDLTALEQFKKKSNEVIKTWNTIIKRTIGLDAKKQKELDKAIKIMLNQIEQMIKDANSKVEKKENFINPEGPMHIDVKN